MGRPDSLRLELGEIRARTVLWASVAATVAINVISLVSRLAARALDRDSLAIIDVGDEVSIGTWFQSLLLFVCAAALYVVAVRSRWTGDGLVRRWQALAAVFVLLSIDEAASMHERAGSAMRSVLDTGGWLYYIWVIPAVVFAAGVGLSSIELLKSVPARTSRLMVGSGVAFVACAGGLELLAGPEAEEHGTDTLVSILFTAVEESGEMLSLCVFLYALVDLLSSHTATIVFRSSNTAETTDSSRSTMASSSPQ